MEPEGSLLQSQLPATFPYPELARSSPYPHIPLPEDDFWTLLQKWFLRSLWSISSYKHVPILDGYGFMAAWNLE